MFKKIKRFLSNFKTKKYGRKLPNQNFTQMTPAKLKKSLEKNNDEDEHEHNIIEISGVEELELFKEEQPMYVNYTIKDFDKNDTFKYEIIKTYAKNNNHETNDPNEILTYIDFESEMLPDGYVIKDLFLLNPKYDFVSLILRRIDKERGIDYIELQVKLKKKETSDEE